MTMPAEDAYFQIGADQTQVWSTVRKMYVPANDAGFLAWCAEQNQTAIVVSSESRLDALLDDIGLGSLAPHQSVAELRKRAFIALPERVDLITRLTTATPAQIDTWLANNVTTLAQARTVLGTIIKVMAAYPPA